ncbi:MAG: LysM peptidoglycan-binding domain-containing protein, partial [Pseudomonadota bacterium]
MAIFQTHLVQSGDTLNDLAQTHNVSVADLIRWNELASAEAISVGQTLKVKPLSDTFYTVRSGDTLTAIAARHAVTVGQIVSANGLPNANRIDVGQRLLIPAAGSAITASSISPLRALGNLSKKYEVGNRGPGTVSGGHGDPGGVSYGSYQLASKFGNARKFLADEGEIWEAEFAGLEEGTPSFSAVWKAIAEREPTLFHDAQHDFIQRTHFVPQVAKIQSLSGIDVMTRSHALMDVTWSVAVQHGANSSLIGRVLASLEGALDAPDYDQRAIKAIYGERGRTNAAGNLVHFSSASAAVQRGVARRFRNELNDALDMLAAEATLSVITPPVDASREESSDLLAKAQRTLTDDEVHTLIEKYGDLEAKNNFLGGQKVVIALRNPTDSKGFLRGAFDDPFLMVWREGDGAVRLKRYMGNTEPARIYAWGEAKADKGSSVDLDGDGRNDLGRLRAGTYHYGPRLEGPFLGAKAFRARNVQVAMRDVNHDGVFSILDGDAFDPTGAGRTMLLHRGGSGDDTWSAGCQ